MEDRQGEISLADIRKYVTYAKQKYHPRITEESGHMLQDLYVSDRQTSKN